MADIGSILLPDPNLMDSYQRSFDKQMALKQYVAQDSRQQEQQFYKESNFALDADLAAYKGQSAAMALNIQKYMQHRQELSADRSRGGFFGLDPKAQAELAAEKYSLMQDQAQRLQSITKLTSAMPVINNPNFALTHDTEWTAKYMKDIQDGKLRTDEPIKTLPLSTAGMVTDWAKKFDRETTQTTPTIKGDLKTSKTISYLPILGGSDLSKYDKVAYASAFNDLKDNTAYQAAALSQYNGAIEKDPSIEKDFAHYGKDAPFMYAVTKDDKLIRSEIGLRVKPNTDIRWPDRQTQAEKDKILTPGADGIIELRNHNIKTYSDLKSGSVNDVIATQLDIKNKKAWGVEVVPGSWGMPGTKKPVPMDYEATVKLAHDKGLTWGEPSKASGKGQRVGKITGSN